MCGIVGYVGKNDAGPIILDGLKRLEYRGYDSSGIAVITPNGDFIIEKRVGKLNALAASLEATMPKGSVGIGHTRWATHGKPTMANAHPHTDCRGEVVVIHNGIVENYLKLKHQLIAEGHTFTSQTDTEVIPHLIESLLSQGHSLEDAVRLMLGHLEGAHAIVVVSKNQPDRVIAAKVGNAGGVVVGYGEGEMFVSSDLPALLPHTRKVVFLASHEVASITSQGAVYRDASGAALAKAPQLVPYDPIAAAKGGYKHFMLKEIMEQPQSIMNTMRGRLEFEPPDLMLEDISLTPQELASIKRIYLVACGTSLDAALVGKFMIEELARLPVEVDYSSEFRYRDPLVDNNNLLIAITQSGETVDTLAAMEDGKARGAKEIAICNVEGSQATRVADGVIYTRSGPEIGVCSTKAFTGQLVALYLLAAYLGKVRGLLGEAQMRQAVEGLSRIPQLMGQLLEKDDEYRELAHQYFRLSDFLYLGRGVNYPIALEGALKLKEISYIHAEGYPAGEMKHGPIALIDENMPVVAIALKDKVYDKMLNNIEQVKARDGIVIALATEGDADIASKADHVIYIPKAPPLLSPLLTVVPLQLLAYHIAVRRGWDVDQPRNLAKSVTVE